MKSNSSNRYEKIKKLGEGTFGCVHQVLDRELEVTVAMKKIKFVQEDEGVPVNALREISLLKHLKHPNIIQIHDVHYNWEESKIFFTMDFMAENLFDHCKANHPLSPFTVKHYIWQLLNVLRFLEVKGIIHRDIKPQNVLIAADGSIKLCDFGQSRLCHRLNFDLSEQISTLWYKAPEVLLGAQEYGNKVDVWAVGCVLAQISQGHPLFRGDSEVGQIFEILSQRGSPKGSLAQSWKHFSNVFPKFPNRKLVVKELSKVGLDLLDQMLQLDPLQRITLTKALQHDYFRGCSHHE